MKNKLISGIISTALILSPIAAHANHYVTVDGKMLDNRVYVPIRETGEQLGAKISWNQKTKTAVIQKDGNQLVAKVGPYVKILDGRVYVQLREVNDTFFDHDPIGWSSSHLMASNNHFYVSVAPLETSTALKLVSASISNKKERAELVEKANGAELTGELTWEGFNKFKVNYSVEWKTGDYSYRTGNIEIKLKRSGEKWIPYSYQYDESWGVVVP